VNSTDNNSGCSYADSVFITVGQEFSLAITPDTTICDVAGIQLSAVPSSGTDVNFLWSPNIAISSPVSATPVVTPTSTTTYSVTATSAEGCSATADVTITVGTLLSLNATVSDADICAGDTVTLHANVGTAPNITFLWSPATTLNDATAQHPQAYPLQDTWYVVEAHDTISGCVLRDSVEVSVTNVGGIDAGNDTTVCTTDGLVLHVDHNIANPQIQWQPANYLSGANTANPTVLFDSTATYTVTVGDGVGCAALDVIVVTVAFPQLITLTDSSLCAGDSAVLDPGFPGAPRLWSTGATSQSITVNSAGTYTCTLTDVSAACSVDAVTTITVDPLPPVDLGPDSSLCIGQQYTLDAGNPGSAILWSTGAVSQSITTGQPGMYSVSVTDQEGCIGRDSVLVTFDPLPVIDLHDTTVCVSETVTLDAGNAGSSYLWSPTGETTQAIDVLAASGTYTVVVTTPTYCVDSAQAALLFIPFPVVDLGPDTALCHLDSLTLDADCGNCGFLWNTGATGRWLTVTTTDNYRVEAFNGYCTSYDTVQVIFNPLPNELPVHAISACFDYPPNQIVLDAGNAGCSFLWHPGGETSGMIPVSQYGLYTVDITTPENCTITQDVVVNEYCKSSLFMPNAFTPNGDGRNDIFGPAGTNLADLELYIFDRWGEVIHHGLDAEAWWDGTTSGGTPCQLGVYTWKLTYRFFEDADHTVKGAEQEAVGHITLLR
jgi:gliding motility-associated-like protein